MAALQMSVSVMEPGPEHRLLAAVGLLHDGQHRVLGGTWGHSGSDAQGSPGAHPIHFPAGQPPPCPPGWVPCVQRASGHHTPFPAPATPLFLQRLPPSTRRRLPPRTQAIPAAAKPTFPRGEHGEGGQHSGEPPATGGNIGDGRRQQAWSQQRLQATAGGPGVPEPRLAQSLQATRLPHRGRQSHPTRSPGEA